MAKKLYIGNLKFGMTDQDLREAFAGFGEIVSATIIKDKASGRSKGFGFIEFVNEADAQKAKMNMNGKEVQGRVLRIDDAKSQ